MHDINSIGIKINSSNYNNYHNYGGLAYNIYMHNYATSLYMVNLYIYNNYYLCRFSASSSSAEIFGFNIFSACSGSERRLIDCRGFIGRVTDCSHAEDIALYCIGGKYYNN